MQLRTINELAMMKTVTRLILENPIDPPNLRVTALVGEINTSIAAVEAAAQEQVQGRGEARGGVGTRREVYRALRIYAGDVCRVARSLDRDAHPGVAEKFILPRSKAYDALIFATRAMITDATALEEEFIAHGLPATFLADLGALATALETGLTAKITGLLQQIGGTAGLLVKAAEGLRAVAKLDAIMLAIYRNDPVKLEVWRHARHVHVANAPTPAPQPGTGSTEGGTAA